MAHSDGVKSVRGGGGILQEDKNRLNESIEKRLYSGNLSR
jgi:hypothetical protein